jgi:hypothetical protein
MWLRTLLALFLLSCLWNPTLQAKASDTLWTRTYGEAANDYGRSVCQSVDGGYAIAGYRESFSPTFSSDVYLVRTDRHGDTLWTRVYENTTLEHAHAIRQTFDGGYVVAGRTRDLSAGSSDIYLLKTDADGDTLWTRTYGGGDTDLGYCVQQTYDGGYVVVGATYSYGAGLDDGYVIKVDENGDSLWSHTFGGAYEERFYSVEETPDMGLVIAGFTASTPDSSVDVYVVRLDASGDTLWTRTYGDTSYDYARDIECTYPDEGFIVVGGIRYTEEEGTDVYLIRIDAAGDTLWTRVYGGSGGDYAVSIERVADDGYVIAGYTDSYGAAGSDVYVLRTEAGGDTSWMRTYGGPGTDRGNEVIWAYDGSFIVAGDTGSFGKGGFDYYLLRMACDAAFVAEDDEPHQLMAITAAPNPFKASTRLGFALPAQAPVQVTVYDVRGRMIAALADDALGAGGHDLKWTGTDTRGLRVAPGPYFVRLVTPGHSGTVKLILSP